MPFSVPLILASASPRRRELLGCLKIPFTIDAADVDETCDLPAGEAVVELSRRKAEAVARMHPDCVVLAADTLVSVDDVPLGKPKDAADAHRMLRMLSDRWSEVYTGVCVIAPDGTVQNESVCAGVHFESMTDEEIDRYIATGEPMDKAGAYAVQGIAGMWIDEIRGSISNVIGLPMTTVRHMLGNCGYDILKPAE